MTGTSESFRCTVRGNPLRASSAPPTAAEYEFAAKIEVLKAALRKWKCHHCGGDGQVYRGYRNDPFPKPTDGLAECLCCRGTGVAQIAAAALREVS